MDKSLLKWIKNGAISVVVLGLFLFAFYIIADEQIHYSDDISVMTGGTSYGDLPVLNDNTVEQHVNVSADILESITVFFVKGGEGNASCDVLITDSDGNEIAARTYTNEMITSESWCGYGLGDIELNGASELVVSLTAKCDEGTTLYVPYTVFEKAPAVKCYVNGVEEENKGALLGVVTKNVSIYSTCMLEILLGKWAVFVLYIIKVILDLHRKKNTLSTSVINNWVKYKFLMKQLVERDFKIKYKRSILGIGWSLLNPLLTMSVQYVVFSHIFKFDIEYYPVYLLIGIVVYSGFTECSTQSISAIVGNASLITKVYMPKTIYPISRVLSSFINVLFSMIPLVVVIVAQGLRPNWAYIYIPYILVMLLFFTMGISLLISAAMVFFRDIQFLWGVFTLMWMYATPVIYSIEMLPETMQAFMKYNPMYHYITFMRTIIIGGMSPQPESFLICFVCAVLSMVIGYVSFNKMQKKFIFYL